MSQCAWTFYHPHGVPNAVTRFILDGDNLDTTNMHSPGPVTLDLCGSCAAYFRREVEPNPVNRIEIELSTTPIIVSRERVLA